MQSIHLFSNPSKEKQENKGLWTKKLPKNVKADPRVCPNLFDEWQNEARETTKAYEREGGVHDS